MANVMDENLSNRMKIGFYLMKSMGNISQNIACRLMEARMSSIQLMEESLMLNLHRKMKHMTATTSDLLEL